MKNHGLKSLVSFRQVKILAQHALKVRGFRKRYAIKPRPRKLGLRFLILAFSAITLGVWLSGKEEKQKPKPEPRIEISGVSVKKFFKDEEAQLAFLTLVKTKDYHIFYLPREELFYISIVSYPYDGFRPLAERQLLQTLGIDEKEACRLNVDTTTPMFANPDKAGSVYRLSFCNDK